MGHPAHSLNVVANPPATSSLRLAYQWREEDLGQISVIRHNSCSLTINTSRGPSTHSWAAGFNFLCFPPHFGTQPIELAGRKRQGICLLPFRNHQEYTFARPYSVGVSMDEDQADRTRT